MLAYFWIFDCIYEINYLTKPGMSRNRGNTSKTEDEDSRSRPETDDIEMWPSSCFLQLVHQLNASALILLQGTPHQPTACH